MTAPGRLILVRHGETTWNQEGKFLGHSDPGLNETGEFQARKAADILRGETIDQIFSSDALRAIETSLIIAQGHDVCVKVMSSLREINFGAWEGLTFEEIQTRYPVLLNKWLEDPFKVRIPDGETAEEVWCRVLEAWEVISAGTSDKDTVVIVAHGGPLRLLACHLTGIDSSRQWEFTLGHGEIFTIERNCLSRVK